jgi:hypothetical protein
VKKAILLATVMLLAVLVFAPMGLAQELETTVEGTGAVGDLPESGGLGILLPAAALLLGSGILTFAVLRRR